MRRTANAPRPGRNVLAVRRGQPHGRFVMPDPDAIAALRYEFPRTYTEPEAAAWVAAFDAVAALAPARECARCGKRTHLAPDATCWPCAVAYRDEIIAESQEPSVEALAEALPQHRTCSEDIRGHESCLTIARKQWANLRRGS